MAFRFPSSNQTLFGSTPSTNAFGAFGQGTNMMQQHNPMKDSEVVSPPDDSISALAFSPPSLPQNYLIAGSWDNQVRCWEIQPAGASWQSIPKAQQTHQGPVLDAAWSDDGTRVFTASVDKTVKMWDLHSNQSIQVAQHDDAVKTVHWIKAMNYQCIMSGSWDKTLKFWDTRSSSPMMTIQLNERCYFADVYYPMAVVGVASKGVIVYQLENQPSEYKRIDSPLKHQNRCISIFTDKKNHPAGFAIGSVEGRVAIQYVAPQSPKDNFTFKCHRSNGSSSNGYQDIFAVNDIAFHLQHGTLATVGSDGRFSFWDKDARTRLKTSEQMELPISRCSISAKGEIFAYSVSYDWSKGHEYHNPHKKNYIFLHSCFDEFKSRTKN